MNTITNDRIRPLGIFSDYVTRELPGISKEQLAEDADFLNHKAEQLRSIPDLNEQAIFVDIAMLDTAMIESACHLHGIAPGEHVRALTDMFAQKLGAVPGLTYHAIVLSNPLRECSGRMPMPADPRFFSSKNDADQFPDGCSTADHERVFYQTHQDIEHACYNFIVSMNKLLRDAQPEPRAIEHVISQADQSADSMLKSFEQMETQLSPERFDMMRSYFHNDHRQGVGPSGLFSGGMFAFDALVCGNDAEMQQFCRQKMKMIAYYPTSSTKIGGYAGQSDMQRAMDAAFEGRTLSDLATNSLQSALRQLYVKLEHARAAHVRIGKMFVPKAFESGGRGTGGKTGLEVFLRIPVNIYKRLSETSPT